MELWQKIEELIRRSLQLKCAEIDYTQRGSDTDYRELADAKIAYKEYEETLEEFVTTNCK